MELWYEKAQVICKIASCRLRAAHNLKVATRQVEDALQSRGSGANFYLICLYKIIRQSDFAFGHLVN